MFSPRGNPQVTSEPRAAPAEVWVISMCDGHPAPAVGKLPISERLTEKEETA